MTDEPFFSSGGDYGNRVERSFAFIDLSGFTAYTSEQGDTEAVRVLSLFRAAVRSVAAQRGVRVAKWLGDGAMLVGIEVEPLVEAVIAIERRITASGSPLPLRAGIAAGPVIMFEGDDYIGSAVNLAARLCDQAEPHQVIAPAEIVSSLLVNTAASSIGLQEVPGLSHPVDVVSLDWA